MSCEGFSDEYFVESVDQGFAVKGPRKVIGFHTIDNGRGKVGTLAYFDSEWEANKYLDFLDCLFTHGHNMGSMADLGAKSA
jgi:hypothetical protein